MRTVRWLAIALAFAALTPAVGQAQEGRLFRDAWFWGVKTGVISFSNGFDRKQAPLIGAEWMITRTRGGLYIAAEQIFFDDNTALVDEDGAGFTVRMHNMKRVSAAAVVFPVNYGTLRPYAGIGLALNFIGRTSVEEPFIDEGQQTFINSQVDDGKDAATFLVMGGVQAQYRRFSAFGQAVLQTRNREFLLGKHATYMLEAGIRVNVGTSRDPK
jgi:hypothetical protein